MVEKEEEHRTRRKEGRKEGTERPKAELTKVRVLGWIQDPTEKFAFFGGI